MHTLLKLHEAGYRWNVDELCGWALGHGFTGAEDSPFRPLPTDPFAPGAIERWQDQAS
ncbi:hypothetical protein ACH419_30640 [Streptomyces bobili]|uniref:hypothetical protein n=1 Tax=Streptomyces bobili TaxID=67280 RepID=UPI00379A2693